MRVFDPKYGKGLCYGSVAFGLLMSGIGCGSGKPDLPKDSAAKSPDTPAETLRISRTDATQAAGNGIVSRTAGVWKVVANGAGAFAAATSISDVIPGANQWSGQLEAHVQVTKGTVSFSLLTADYRLLNEQAIHASPDWQQIAIPVSSNQNVKAFLIRGGDAAGVSSEALVDRVDLALSVIKLPTATMMTKGGGVPGATVEPGPPIRIVTAASPYTYAMTFPLAIDHVPGFLFLRVKGKVVRGQIGIGILNRDEREFQSQEYHVPATGSGEIVIPIPKPSEARAIIIRNGQGGVSEFLLDDVGVYSTR